jgi:hypothetical protein
MSSVKVKKHAALQAKPNMWGKVLATAAVTVCIMAILHHTYNHLQSMLTVPKVADLVRRPVQKYTEIERVLQDAARPAAKAPAKPELRAFLSQLRH